MAKSANKLLPGYDASKEPGPAPVDSRSPTQKVLDSWINQPESQLVQEWGIPDKQMAGEEAQKLYEYKKCSAPVASTHGQSFRYYGTQITSTNQHTVVRQDCARWTFMIAEGSIIHARFDPE